nr:MAG TPA: hypothetical protein [Caudoviricetes sp.]
MEKLRLLATTIPAGLAWPAICCTVWHGSITGAHRCTLIYLIIIGRLRWPVQRPGVVVVSWYALEALRRCDTLQHCTGDIIAACVSLVFAAGEWGKRQKKHL